MEKELNFDTTYRCPLACPKCMRQKYKKRGLPIGGVDCSLESFDKLTDHFTSINFCGQVSDPTAGPKFIEMLEICRDKNTRVTVHTAASHKPIQWYKRAFQTCPNAVWEFGLDGLPETSHLYRVNQDGNKIWNVMKWASGEGYFVDWQWIYFDYNWRDVPKGFQMAKKHKINFITVTSHRWEPVNDPLRPPDEVMRCKDVYEVMDLIEYMKANGEC